MNLDETLLYLLVAAAVIACSMALFGRSSGANYGIDRETGWERLPLIFKAAWPAVLLCEESVGRTLAALFSKGAARLQAAISPAALPLNPPRVYAASLGVALALGSLGLVGSAGAMFFVEGLSVYWIPGATVGLFLFGWVWPMQNLKAYAALRQRELTRQLPFAIDLISSAMHSGLEFGAAMRYYVGINVGGALPEEFGRVLNDITLGKVMHEALKEMANRVRLDCFTAFVSSVSYGVDVGAPISEALKIHAAEMRRVRFAMAERKAARAPSVMLIPLALFIMPTVFIVVVTPLILQMLHSH